MSWNPQLPNSLASGGADNLVKIWSLESSEPLRTLSGHQDRVNRVVFHPSGRCLASTSFDRTWSLWDVETGQELQTQGGNSRAVYGISFHPDGALVATGGFDAVGRIWDIRSGRVIWNARGHAKQILSVDWNPDGVQFATGSDDRTVRVWDLRKKKTVYFLCLPLTSFHFFLIVLLLGTSFRPTRQSYLWYAGSRNMGDFYVPQGMIVRGRFGTQGIGNW